MRIRKLITILDAHNKWLKENKVSLSRLVQKTINKLIEEELITRTTHYLQN